MFDDYAYLSSTSKALRQHFQGMVEELVARHDPEPGAVIVDVGANDGVTLDRYPADRFRLIGVEPSSAGRYAAEKGHHVLKAFFGRETGRAIRDEHGPVALATATNVCAHVDDIGDFMAGFAEMLAPDGVAVFECSYLLDMVEGVYFDTVYHEHLNYHALTPLTHLFERVGLQAIRAERIDFGASGPAIRVTVARADGVLRPDHTIAAFLAEEEAWGVKDEAPYQAFARRVAAVIEELRETIGALKASGERLAAFSAPAKGNTLLNSARLTTDELEAVSENNPLKIGKLTPGSHLPVISDEEFLKRDYDTALLLSWNYADFFVKNSEFVKRGGRFLAPLPSPVLRP
ncbi:MAG: class I SAM-dependent methyltransferase [Pseudomonadota bacterium]